MLPTPLLPLLRCEGSTQHRYCASHTLVVTASVRQRACRAVNAARSDYIAAPVAASGHKLLCCSPCCSFRVQLHGVLKASVYCEHAIVIVNSRSQRRISYTQSPLAKLAAMRATMHEVRYLTADGVAGAYVAAGEALSAMMVKKMAVATGVRCVGVIATTMTGGNGEGLC